MKERPILFSGDMVRAILDGRKTMTRRIMKPQPIPEPARIKYYGDRYGFMCESNSGKVGIFTPPNYYCPYGTIRDRLWVRETTEIDREQDDRVELSRYSADKAPVLYSLCSDKAFNGTVAHWDYPRDVRPSIYMPRWASRITLEITNIRVERLNDISDKDAKAEGCWYGIGGGEPDAAVNPINHFPTLWESINGSGSWEKNPWVWCISFRRVK